MNCETTEPYNTNIASILQKLRNGEVGESDAENNTLESR